MLELFDRVDDKAGALSAYDAFARRLKTEYGAEPALETRSLAERIRTRVTHFHTADPKSAPRQVQPTVAALEAHVPPADVDRGAADRFGSAHPFAEALNDSSFALNASSYIPTMDMSAFASNVRLRVESWDSIDITCRSSASDDLRQ